MALVKLFGQIGDVAGWSEKTVPGLTLGEVRSATGCDNQQLAEHLARSSTLVIINETMTPLARLSDDMAIAANAEVVFASPFSGG